MKIENCVIIRRYETRVKQNQNFRVTGSRRTVQLRVFQMIYVLRLFYIPCTAFSNLQLTNIIRQTIYIITKQLFYLSLQIIYKFNIFRY